MKTTSHLIRAADLSLVGLLAALVGCVSSPLSQSTLEADATPAFATNDSSEYQPPLPLHQVPPGYPFDMRRSGISGRVNVTFLIDENGKVREAMVQDSTNHGFNQAALAAARQWTFRPAQRKGVAVPARANLPIVFAFAEP